MILKNFPLDVLLSDIRKCPGGQDHFVSLGKKLRMLRYFATLLVQYVKNYDRLRAFDYILQLAVMGMWKAPGSGSVSVKTKCRMK